jgi:hypothetical protein
MRQSNWDKAGVLIDVNVASSDDVAIQCERAVESLDNFTQDVRVLSERIGIKGRHHAAGPEVLDADYDVTDQELPTGPFPLLETGDSSNDYVGPKSPPIVPELSNRTVSCDQKREDVEAIHTLVVDETRARPNDPLYGS